MLKQTYSKELQKNLAKIEKMDQEIHQIKLVIFKYIKPLISKDDFAFNNLFGQWISIYPQEELGDTLSQIRQEWTKEIKELD